MAKSSFKLQHSVRRRRSGSSPSAQAGSMQKAGHQVTTAVGRKEIEAQL